MASTRRTFMQATIGVAAGLLVFRGRESTAVASRPPPPRWEWEVGEWYGRCRKWRAEVDITADEAMEIATQANTVNSKLFCGVRGGHIQICNMQCRFSGGLCRATVRLTECRSRMDGVRIIDARFGKHRVCEPHPVVNFYELLRGGHAVLEVDCVDVDFPGGWLGGIRFFNPENGRPWPKGRT